MSSLNLSSDGGDVRASQSYFSGGALISFIILVCSLVLYGALLYLRKDVSAKIEASQAQFQKEFDEFMADGNANVIIDFQNRSLYARNLIDGEQRGSEILGKIEETILPAVYLDGFEYDKEEKTISLSCSGDNFNTVAKQILNFKDSGYFSAVTPGDSSLKSGGDGVTFKIGLTLK